jgi:hypothetical protein
VQVDDAATVQQQQQQQQQLTWSSKSGSLLTGRKSDGCHTLAPVRSSGNTCGTSFKQLQKCDGSVMVVQLM